MLVSMYMKRMCADKIERRKLNEQNNNIINNNFFLNLL